MELVIDLGALQQPLFELNVLVAKAFPKSVLKAACNLILDRIKNGTFDITQAADFGATGCTKDNGIIRLVWRDQDIAATLRAFQRNRNLSTIHVHLHKISNFKKVILGGLGALNQ